jgi:hypothetical protein
VSLPPYQGAPSKYFSPQTPGELLFQISPNEKLKERGGGPRCFKDIILEGGGRVVIKNGREGGLCSLQPPRGVGLRTT